jgi:hypothetical protein
MTKATHSGDNAHARRFQTEAALRLDTTKLRSRDAGTGSNDGLKFTITPRA